MIQVRDRLKRAGCVIINNYNFTLMKDMLAGLPPVRPPREHRLGSCNFDDYGEMLQSLADGPILVSQDGEKARAFVGAGGIIR